MNTIAENDDSSSQQHQPLEHDFKTSMAGIAGNVLEWFDFSCYGFFSDIIGQVFFPPSVDPHGNLTISFLVFGIAFLARPVGAAIFGLMGDNRGRKKALENSILVMALPTFLLGVLPTYASIGWVATALLIFFRILQGLSVGGQFMSSLVFSLEGVKQEHWGMRTAYVNFAVTLGAVLGSFTSYVLREALTEEELKSYGWRIPFFISILGVIPGMYLKYGAKDISILQVDENSKAQKKITVVSDVLGKSNRRAFIGSLFVPMLSAGAYYIVFVWLGLFMESIAHVENGYGINTAVGSTGLVLCFVGGWMSDKFGPKARAPLMLASSLTFGVVAPIFINAIGNGDPTTAFFLQFTMALLIGIYSGSSSPWLVANFPPHLRLTSAALSYNLAVSVVGGFSPALATYLVQKYKNNYAPGYILSVLAVFAWIGIWIVESGPKSGEQGPAPSKRLSDLI